MTRVIFPKEFNKTILTEDIEEIELGLIDNGKMSEQEILRQDDFGNWVIGPINPTPKMIEKTFINYADPESSGDSNTIYSGAAKTSTIGQPIRESYNDYRGEIEDFKPKGKRLPLEQIDKKLLMDDGKILNLTAHDPQKWPTILDMWSQKVCREWESLNVQAQAPQMYSYLEKFLGETVRADWEAYKGNFPEDFNQDLLLGANPYNFVNKIQLIILGQQPNIGIGKQQEEAMRKLEQLQIRQWNYIKPFLQDFVYYGSLAGCFYDRTIGEKLFLKLPAPLGGIIHKKFIRHKYITVPSTGILQFQIEDGTVQGFINNQFFGEIACHTRHIKTVLFGLEVYTPVVTTFNSCRVNTIPPNYEIKGIRCLTPG